MPPTSRPWRSTTGLARRHLVPLRLLMRPQLNGGTLGRRMALSDTESLSELSEKAASAVAIEALWDGDTQGWFVDICAVFNLGSEFNSRRLRSLRGGGDIRLFNGQVPPWPEALEASRVGNRLATLLGVPFHFPSPNHPEDDCPHWWEVGQSHPCTRCGLQLLQRHGCRWRGVCYQCHLEIEREAKEAQWSPEERTAPRCSMCGEPAVGATGSSPRCRRCRDDYRTFACPSCGTDVTVHREFSKAETCSSCAIAKRLSALSPDERQRLREAAAKGAMAGLAAAREILQCGLHEAQAAAAELSRITEADG